MGARTRHRRALAAAVGPLSVVPLLTVTPAAAAAPQLFGAPVAYDDGPRPEAVAVVDANDDGRLDVLAATAGPGDNALLVFLARADGTLEYHEALPIGGRAGSIATGDLTGDGVDEVAVAVRGVGIEVFGRYAPGGYDTMRILRTSDDLRVRIADVDGDELDDVISLGWGTDTVTVHHQRGGWDLGPPVVHAAPHSGYDDLEVGDVTGDGLTDVVVMSGQLYATPNVTVLRQTPNGVLTNATSHDVSSEDTLTRGVGVGDVSGDGIADVVASFGGNRPASGIAVFASEGWDLAEPVTTPSYDVPEPVVVTDVDGDGRSDVVVLHGGWQRAGVYRQTADGNLATEELYPIPYASHYSPHGLAVGDVTGDGRPDLVIADSNHGLVVVPNTGDEAPAPEPGRAIVATPEVAVVPEDEFAEVAVERVEGSDGPLSVPWVTVDGTAVAGVDYERSSGTITFPDGSTRATVRVPITAEPGPGEDRSFSVWLDPSTAAPAPDQVATITIARDPVDPVADLAVSLTSSSEAPRRGEIVTLTATATAVDGTAAAPRLTVELGDKVDVVATRTVGCDAAGQLACSRDTLSPGAAMRLEVDVVATKGGWIDAVATVSAESEDPDATNDVASQRIKLR